MKLFFISDIHGSIYYLKKAFECFKQERADGIILLGDSLYHGPRNPLPKEYNPKEVSDLLNEYKENIIAVRGNCDSEVDAALLNYPMMSDYSFILFGERRVFLTHGHLYNPDKLPALKQGDIFAYGHTHIYQAENVNGIFLINPGSVSLPKAGNTHTYGILRESSFEIKDLEGKEIKKLHIE
ncbi:phosphodiesterase [Clostridium sp. 19966]|uniref:phosphodiesterase n=1 Tax=Clostridium sp. 19966 TaxID=2768166 RepID=UPI0028DE5C92|nr:phosphodiesterase [Clostridium sp. 19966]MDT8718109.1 phosphodiesterase [Clostridium sp. 19966]